MDQSVQENFLSIFAKFKKVTNNKEVIENLEKKFFAGDNVFVKAVKEKNSKKERKTGKKRNFNKFNDNDSISEKVSDSEAAVANNPKQLRARQPKRNNNIIIDDDSDNFIDEESEEYN